MLNSFQLNCCFPGEPAINHISSHQPSLIPLPPPVVCIYRNQAIIKKNNENHHLFTALQFFHHQFFNSIVVSGANTWSVISQHTDWSLPPHHRRHPCEYTATERWQQTTARSHHIFTILWLLHSPFLSIKLFISANVQSNLSPLTDQTLTCCHPLSLADIIFWPWTSKKRQEYKVYLFNFYKFLCILWSQKAEEIDHKQKYKPFSFLTKSLDFSSICKAKISRKLKKNWSFFVSVTLTLCCRMSSPDNSQSIHCIL